GERAAVGDCGRTPVPGGNENLQWNLVTGTAVTLDSTTPVQHNTQYVTARSNGFVKLAVKDASGNNFGTDTLPILVQQLPSVVVVTPDTVSVLVGNSTTFRGTVLDAGGDTMAIPVHWRDDNTVNRHLTITDSSVANQVTVRLDSTPFGSEYITGYAIGGPGDTAYGYGQVINPLALQLTVGQQPWAVAANSQTHAVYVGHQGGQLYRLNGTTEALVDSLSAGAFTSSVAVNSITNHVFVGTDQGVAVVDGATFSPVAAGAPRTTPQGGTKRPGPTVDSLNNPGYLPGDI